MELTVKELIHALLQAQREIKHATKDAKNPHFKNDYATLESVLNEAKPILNRHGIFLSQVNGKDELGQYVETRLMHESGQVHSSRIYLIIDKANMQGFGSAETYARRYDLAAILGITQVDDDGQLASNNNPSWNKTNQIKGSQNGNKNEL